MHLTSPQDRDIVLVSIFTFITIVAWISFEFLKTAKTTTVSEPVQQLLTPLNSNLDLEILNELETRRVY